MNIAQVSCTFPPERGGIGQVAYEYATRLAALGHHVTVLAPSARKNLVPKTFRLKPLTPWLRYGNAALCPQVTWGLNEFDVIHLHWPFIGTAEWILIARILTRAFHIQHSTFNIIVTYHMDLQGRGLWKGIFWLYQLLTIPLLKYGADYILATTKDYAETSPWIGKWFNAHPSQCHVLPLGIEFIHASDALKRYSNNIHFVFIAKLDRAHYFKGLTIALHAFGQLKRSDWDFTIVGSGNLESLYKRHAQEVGIADHIDFVGEITDVQRTNILLSSDVLLFPSIDRSEAFGLVALEAMACGVPVVASDLPGVRSVVTEECGWLVKPNDSEHLARVLYSIIDQPTTIKERGTMARRRVEEYFQWPMIMKRLTDYYKTLA